MHATTSTRTLFAIGGTALAVAVLGTSNAMAGFMPSPADGRIRACVDDRTGAPRVVLSVNQCRRGESWLVWNAQGVRGEQGPRGLRGIPGVAGADGLAGTAGQDGTAGRDGKDGAAGAQGPVGPQGDTGATGPAGAHGATGATGATGARGQDGRGYTSRGAWIQASSYSVNDVVTHGGGSYAALADVPAGSAAPADDTTAWQLIAARGATGAPGEQGAQGQAGPVGPAGPQGPQGQTGATGPQGQQGAQGQTGATGATGATGQQGPQGPQGPQGGQGPQGTAGADAVAYVTSVAADGTVDTTRSNATGVTASGSVYTVTFPLQTGDDCVAAATMRGDATAKGVLTTAQATSGGPIEVRTFDLGGNPTALPFTLLVRCL